MKKRALKTALILLGMLFAIRLSASANVGDPLGVAYHTDIVAYINNFAIPSYAVNGQSCIVAEDLKSYGFIVEWDNASRTLSISRNHTAYAKGMSFSKNGKSGDFFADILETDIAVYANNKRLTSFALNGYTMIPMEELTDFGNITWLSDERALVMNIYGLNSRSERQYVAEYTEPVASYETTAGTPYNVLKNFIIQNGNYLQGSYYIKDTIGTSTYYIWYDTENGSITFDESTTLSGGKCQVYLFLYENKNPGVSVPMTLKGGYKTEFMGTYYSPQITVIKSTFPENNNNMISLLSSTYKLFDLLLKNNGLNLKISDFNIAY